MPYTFNIQNIVASVDYSRSLNLSTILKEYSSTEYRPEQFPGLVYRLWKPKLAMLIFSSGKMVCTGAKSVKDVYKGVNKVTKDVITKCFGKQLKPPVINIQNIVASGNFYGDVILEEMGRLYSSSRYRCMYEPEQFPGAIVRDRQKVEITNQDGKKSYQKKVLYFFYFPQVSLFVLDARLKKAYDPGLMIYIRLYSMILN